MLTRLVRRSEGPPPELEEPGPLGLPVLATPELVHRKRRAEQRRRLAPLLHVLEPEALQPRAPLSRASQPCPVPMLEVPSPQGRPQPRAPQP